ncbi:PAS domain S-box protein [Halomicroarcula sp. F13]|uniref:histidine kinase n=1 Tax=Haloarcula rubra TaxID=2487747 RepID=A0AAW4PNI6_9EURY|nr:PAS domain S-box protein [Halomicroarcula rubra]MBX0321957.1 PAS domain S-box protein [Halomicroarcula rubra]
MTDHSQSRTVATDSQQTERTTILYVDADPATRERTRAEVTEHRADIDVAAVGSTDAALDVGAATPPESLVVDPVGIEGADRLVDTFDCPVVLYSARDPADVDEALIDAATTVVEKGADANESFLAEKVASVVEPAVDRSTHAFQTAVEDVADRADEGELTVLVDDAGDPVWSRGALDGVGLDFGATNVYDAVATLASDTAADDVAERLRDDPTDPVTVRVETDQNDRHLRLRGYDLPAAAGSLRLFEIEDITGEARREARLSRLEGLTEQAQDGLYTLDERGVVDYCNASFAEMLGYEPSELTGKHASETLAPGELATGQETIEQLLEDEADGTSVDLTFRCKDGTEREISVHYTLLRDDSGTYRGLHGVARDVTERREREREFRERTELFEQLVDRFPNGTVFLFDEEFRYTEAGGEDLAAHGFEPSDFVGKTPREVLPPENASLLEEAYEAAFEGRTSAFVDEYRGTHYYVQVIPIRDDDGAVVSGMTVAQNITDRVEYEQELEQSNALLSTLLDALPVGILVEDDDREILTANQRLVDVFDIPGSAEDLVGTDCSAAAERVSQQFADPESFLAETEQLLADRSTDLRTDLELSDGRTVQRSYIPIDLPDSEGNLWLYRDVTEQRDRERELERTTERLELALEGAELGVWDWNVETGDVAFDERWVGMLGYSLSEIEQRVETWEELVHPDDTDRAWDAIQAHFDGESDIYQCDHRLRTKDGDYKWIRDIGRVFERDEDGTPLRAVGIHQDITERKHRQQELEAQRDDLATLTQVQVLIQDVIRALGTAATRDEIETTVCDRLVESEFYELAWIGERAGPDNRITREAVAGDEDGYLDIVADRTTPSDRAHGPGTVAIQTGDVQVVDDIATDDRLAGWRDEALDRNYRSAVVVPLRHDDVVHGVLVVYANRVDAFSDRVVDAFTVLGEMVGFAFTAVQNRRLLTHDRVLEMEFESEDRDAYPIVVASRHDCRLEAAGSVDVGDEALQYIRVDGAPPADVLESLLTFEPILDGRVVRAGADGGVVEVRTTETYQSLLLDVGARLVDAVAEPTRLSVVVEAPTDADPRTIQETLSAQHSGFDLVAKREREHRPTTVTDDSPLRDQLTDRQLEVLRAAYLAGYYEWPRDTTAEQLADTLDISSPTLHQHLRRAERNLFDALLDV